ncbi:MAG: DUF350 domain-containing protein [Oligoflexia bacterium]|nr:DUF350 domain-containing protein [Oligoflexia bacterium]
MENGFVHWILSFFEDTFWHNCIYLMIVILMIFVGKWLFNFITSYSLKDELTKKDNLAIALATNGYLVGIAIIAVAANIGETLSLSLFDGVLEVVGFSFLGMVLLLISKFVNEKFILKKFSVRKELIDDRNAGTGAVVFGNYVASALIVAEAISVEGGGFLFVLLFFFLGQIFLVAFAHIFVYLMPFDVHSELEKDNVAAGVSLGGALISISIILMKGLSSDSVSTAQLLPNIISFVIVGIFGLFLLSSLRFLFAKFFVFGVDLNKEISVDRNVGVAIIEASMMLIISFSLFFSV